MKNFTRQFLLCLAAIGVLSVTAPAFAQPDTHHAQLRLIPERSPVEGGETFFVAIEQTIDEGWHTYWTNPGDAGQPPTVRWTLPAGFEAGEIHWPAPEKIIT
ncbi:MAG TPA: protein-disulfide reductase DsbD domain-containing protein, partial [Alphaproteobacteria bacterium]